MDFKDRIKDLRVKKDLSHTQLAIVFNKTESAIRSWELGRTKPDADTLIKLAQYFKCTTDYLLGLSDFENAKDLSSTSKNMDKLLFIDKSFEDKKEIINSLGTIVSSTTELERDFLLSAVNFVLYALKEVSVFTVAYKFKLKEKDIEKSVMLFIEYMGVFQENFTKSQTFLSMLYIELLDKIKDMAKEGCDVATQKLIDDLFKTAIHSFPPNKKKGGTNPDDNKTERADTDNADNNEAK